ncbi:carboxymuconolactone decarboxylase family protein [Alphaproteobacteria bacterium]|nr:carboxymuconolactone decarboxylase family protein [Alphaproteobacteria bacterium]
MNIQETLNTFPEYAKDIKLNYSKIKNESIFSKQQLYGIILVSSLATKMDDLVKASLKEALDNIDATLIDDVYGAYSLMSMNAIYYRFTHLATENNYSKMPANLRMQYMNKHKMPKTDFEMLCLAVAIIIGCGKCINAHEKVLTENNISTQSIQSVARIASIVNAIANIMRLQK